MPGNYVKNHQHTKQITDKLLKSSCGRLSEPEPETEAKKWKEIRYAANR
jgi:hypothetical protein